MEQLAAGANGETYDPCDELDDLLAQNNCGEQFRDAIERAVDQTEGLPSHLRLSRLLEINERAIYLDYGLRAGAQSSILDKAMDLCDTGKNPDACWKLHLLQARALSRDMNVLHPDFYAAANVPEMRRETVRKMRDHAKTALRILSGTNSADEESYYFCSRILATFPEIRP